MNTLNIGHIGINVKDVNRMKAFYCGLLGMKIQFVLTLGDLYEYAKKSFSEEELPEVLRPKMEALLAMKDSVWIEYLTFAEGQFLELFYPYGEKQEFPARSDYYGYQKIDYEVQNIQQLYDRLTACKVKILSPLAETAEYALEFSAEDPDGNHVHFVQYTERSRSNLGIVSIADNEADTKLLRTTHVAYQMKNTVEMARFYSEGLGLKKAFSLTFSDAAAFLKGVNSEGSNSEIMTYLESLGDTAWIDFMEIAPHQYIELFHVMDGEKKSCLDLEPFYGYLHLCIEVSDIHEAWEYVTTHGITPDTEINLGPDGAWQFWIVDPDGNRIELMEYSEHALQRYL